MEDVGFINGTAIDVTLYREGGPESYRFSATPYTYNENGGNFLVHISALKDGQPFELVKEVYSPRYIGDLRDKRFHNLAITQSLATFLADTP